jgi:hypothetical protein
MTLNGVISLAGPAASCQGPVYVEGQLLSHIVDGKFVGEWVHWGALGLLRQIGTVPPPKPDRAGDAA